MSTLGQYTCASLWSSETYQVSLFSVDSLTFSCQFWLLSIFCLLLWTRENYLLWILIESLLLLHRQFCFDALSFPFLYRSADKVTICSSFAHQLCKYCVRLTVLCWSYNPHHSIHCGSIYHYDTTCRFITRHPVCTRVVDKTRNCENGMRLWKMKASNTGCMWIEML